MCKTILHPLYVNVELITPDHHVVSRHDELSQRCILREKHLYLEMDDRSNGKNSSMLFYYGLLNRSIRKDNFEVVSYPTIVSLFVLRY